MPEEEEEEEKEEDIERELDPVWWRPGGL